MTSEKIYAQQIFPFQQDESEPQLLSQVEAQLFPAQSDAQLDEQSDESEQLESHEQQS